MYTSAMRRFFDVQTEFILLLAEEKRLANTFRALNQREGLKAGPKSIALPMYINQLFVQMLKDFESYDRRGLDMHQLKATYIRRSFKAFVDEIEFLSLPTTRVYYESYDYLVRRKAINEAQLKVELKRKRSIFTSNPQLKKYCEARGLL